MGKRKRLSDACAAPRKFPKTGAVHNWSTDPVSVQHSLLSAHYLRVQTLRDFVCERLPSTSRVRRKKISAFDADYPTHAGYLDRTLIGVTTEISPAAQKSRHDDLLAFTQTQRSAKSGSRVTKVERCTVIQIIEYAIWSLFQKGDPTAKRPDHVLCYGCQGTGSVFSDNATLRGLCMPGIVRQTRNANIDALSQSPWTDIASLLGTDSENILLSLYIDCGIFERLSTGKDNYYQLSGTPVFRLQAEQADTVCSVPTAGKRLRVKDGATSKLRAIVLVRNRMFYAKPQINGRGQVSLGMKHVHVFNRYGELHDGTQDVHVMRYFFPRQFGLNNVFTSIVGSAETIQATNDYTLREREMSRLDQLKRPKVPRRLRGQPLILIQKIRKNHKKCSYTQLLRYHCSSLSINSDPLHETTHEDLSLTSPQFMTQKNSVSDSRSQSQGATGLPNSESSYLPHATSHVFVSAFCQAVLQRLLPSDTFGTGEGGEHNWRRLLRAVDEFIKMRRFETLSLHEIVQNIKLSCIRWLCPMRIETSARVSLTDKNKRLELLAELIYFTFDSILIPLVRSNFYVTESGVQRNRLLYFRHDVWRKLSEPSLSNMRVGQFKLLNPKQFRRATEANKFGYSQVRLLPKESGTRPINNLKRRSMKILNGRKVFGSSINAQLGPVFSVLNFERGRDPTKLVSALFSVADIRTRLASFKANLATDHGRLYFAKVDIRSCFDTIPQNELLTLVDSLLLESEYQTNKHVEAKRLANASETSGGQTVTRYINTARAAGQQALFCSGQASHIARNKGRTVFVGTDQERTHRVQQIQHLLQDHIRQHIVRIGRRHFQQTNGIPQGSVLSSLLCSYFYDDFQRKRLSFLQPGSSLLLHLIDDFLLITTDEQQARTFVQVMSRGHSEYGITIHPEKSLVNFEVGVKGCQIPRLHGTTKFPYCGLGIDTNSLEISKDRQRKDVHVANALTVDGHGQASHTLQRRILSAFKLQMQAILLDGALNTKLQITVTIFESLTEVAMRLHRYNKALPRQKRPNAQALIKLCEQLIRLTSQVARRDQTTDCNNMVSKAQVCWIVAAAFIRVLARKQAEYRELLRWLRSVESSMKKNMRMKDSELDALVRRSVEPFKDYVY